MKKLLEEIITAIVQNTDAVKITEKTGADDIVTFLISVSEEDMGRVIGKEGKMINAIRNILRVAAKKQNKRIIIDLMDPNNPQKNDS